MAGWVGFSYRWRTKSEYGKVARMAIRACRVTIVDMEGVAHAVEVTAESLFEAVAQGLAAMRGKDWVMGTTVGVYEVAGTARAVAARDSAEAESASHFGDAARAS
jgi:hypothetical protein